MCDLILGTVRYGFRFRSTPTHFSFDESQEMDEDDYAMWKDKEGSQENEGRITFNIARTD